MKILIDENSTKVVLDDTICDVCLRDVSTLDEEEDVTYHLDDGKLLCPECYEEQRVR